MEWYNFGSVKRVKGRNKLHYYADLGNYKVINMSIKVNICNAGETKSVRFVRKCQRFGQRFDRICVKDLSESVKDLSGLRGEDFVLGQYLWITACVQKILFALFVVGAYIKLNSFKKYCTK